MSVPAKICRHLTQSQLSASPHVLSYFRAQKNLRPFQCESQCHDGRVAADRPSVTVRLDCSRYESIEELVVGNESPGTRINIQLT